MALPLSKILNDDNKSPRRKPKRKRLGSDDEDDVEVDRLTSELDTPKTPTKAHASSSDAGRTNNNRDQIAGYSLQPPITFSLQKGSLYERRASRSPTRVPNLPTPPLSQPRPSLFQFPSTCPPTPELDLRKFSVFKALLDYPELTFEMSKHLDIGDLISLYAISKDFHVLVNTRFTTVVLAQSVGKAAESSRTFIFKCYRNLCMADPAARPNGSVVIRPRQSGPSRNAASASGVTEIENDSIRSVPSFRWLRMILYRESVVDGILGCLAAEGHRLPKRASLVLKKIWFMLDISDNGRRVGLMHNKQFWGNKDLFIATMFFLKLDMRLTDPMTGNGETGLRQLLLAQRSLTTLLHTLQRRILTSQLDVLRLIVQHHYDAPNPLSGQSICGIPAEEIGQLQYEGWGKGKPRLFVAVEDLVMREGVRRDLGLERHYLDMMLHGYVDKNSWEDMWTNDQVKARKAREREEARQRGEEVEGCSSPEKKDREWSDTSDEESSVEEEEEKEDGVGEMDWEQYNITSA